MAQFAFVKLHDIDQAGPTGVAQITFIFRVVWVGDELAGPDEVRVVANRGDTNATVIAAARTAIISRAAALGRPGLVNTDIKVIGGTTLFA